MKNLETQYQALLNRQVFDPRELDYKLVDTHIAFLSQLARVANSGITLFDMYRRKHLYTSYNFSELFGYDLDRIKTEDSDYFTARIHPDDVERLSLNGMAALRHFLDGEGDVRHTKMINEYRILNLAGDYVWVIEQFQVLEFSPSGQVWLSLSMLDLSPGGDVAQGVRSRLLNCRTGQAYVLPGFSDGGKADNPLSARERNILRLVSDGLLSKEISERLTISVHTVNTHRQRILEKLNVDNSMEAVRYASRLGWMTE